MKAALETTAQWPMARTLASAVRPCDRILRKPVHSGAGGELSRGFSLIELMIAVAIISILASIALPSYQSSVRKARRGEMQGFLLEAAQREQQWFIDNRRFASSLADLGLSLPDDLTSHYELTVTVEAGPPPNFILTATPISTSNQAVDGPLSIDRSGHKTPAEKW